MARVLVGVDGSGLAHRAAQRAVSLLGPAHEVTVVHVVRPVTPIIPMPGTAIAGTTAMDDEAIAESNRSLVRDAEADVAAMATELGGNAATLVVTGDPGAELCRIADEDHYDVVVVGSQGSGFFKRVLLGSVSHHVLHHATCPVLVVREDAESDHVTEAE